MSAIQPIQRMTRTANGTFPQLTHPTDWLIGYWDGRYDRNRGLQPVREGTATYLVGYYQGFRLNPSEVA